ncbi:MAG TPA: carbon-nitrogen hydrolase family protein, partial [Trebonia sp.]
GSWCAEGAPTAWSGRWRVDGELGSCSWSGDSAPVCSVADGFDELGFAPVDDPVRQVSGPLQDFESALRTGNAPWGEASDNLRSFAIAHAAILSATRREQVLIDELLAALSRQLGNGSDMQIALAQLRPVRGNPDANLDLGLKACADARAQGADLIIFPELWQHGYAPCPRSGTGRERWLSAAQAVDGEWVSAFREIAQSEQVAILTTFLRRTAGGVRDSAAAIGVDGSLALVHDKVHICDFNWESVLEPGPAFEVAPLPLRDDIIRIGVMTCFDREFPESARELALAGAELAAVPNACLICDDRLGQARCRAFENMMALALANYPMPLMNGRSCVFDGMAAVNGRPRDHEVLVADAKPGLPMGHIDLNALREYRANGLWQASRRRVGAYRHLTHDATHGGPHGE